MSARDDASVLVFDKTILSPTKAGQGLFRSMKPTYIDNDLILSPSLPQPMSNGSPVAVFPCSLSFDTIVKCHTFHSSLPDDHSPNMSKVRAQLDMVGKNAFLHAINNRLVDFCWWGSPCSSSISARPTYASQFTTLTWVGRT